MKLLNRKSRLERLIDTVTDSLDVTRPGKSSVSSRIKPSLPSGLKPGSGSGLSGLGASNTLKAGLAQDNIVKAGVIAGGLAGLTAGSAGISSLRRRHEGARNNS